MTGCFRALLVIGIVIGTAAISAAQARGGGTRVSSPAASGSIRSSGPGRATMASAGERSRPPRRPIEPHGAIQRPPFAGALHPNFILWYGYIYFSWANEPMFSAVPDFSTASPLPPPPDGVPTGGLQLAVEPHRAQVYVDGFYAGVTDDFRGYYHHLELSAGPHRVDLLLSGYPPQTLDVLVTPGRTTTYRGTLRSSVIRVE